MARESEAWTVLWEEFIQPDRSRPSVAGRSVHTSIESGSSR